MGFVRGGMLVEARRAEKVCWTKERRVDIVFVVSIGFDCVGSNSDAEKLVSKLRRAR